MSAPFTYEQIAEIRRLVRLEALRASVLSVASESLEPHIPGMVVSVELVDDEFIATLNFHDKAGNAVLGGSL